MTSPLPGPGEKLEHYVSDAPYDPNSIENNDADEGSLADASQLKLMWYYFRQHRLALASGIFLVLVYLSILFSEFLAPYNLHTRNTDFIYAPPVSVHIFRDGSGFAQGIPFGHMN